LGSQSRADSEGYAMRMRRIYLVDDDESLLRTLGRLLRIEGFDVVPFASPHRFIQCLDQVRTGCVISDLKMPEMNGFEMYHRMQRAGCTLPLIFLTGQGAIADTVLAMKLGAVNFLTKPADRDDLLAAINEAFRIQESRQEEYSRNAELNRRFESLTAREKEVCIKVSQGLLNKQIAGDLGVKEKTIKVHRARVLDKLEAGSLAELVRIVDRVAGCRVLK
jgi:FixJ family two-component response regulator